MIQSYFLNGTGLDESATMAGAYGSAEDIARLLAYGIRSNSDVFAATARDTMVITSESGTQHRAVNTNEALNAIPALIAGKTGYTDLAGGNLAIAFDAGLERPMIIVVLGSTQDGRFEDMKTLVDAARAYVSSTE
jgi:D-alanyl-D-alanine carboxypeptidase